MYSTALSLRTKDSIYHRRHFCISGDVRAAEVGGCCGSGCSRAGFSCSSVYDGSRFIYSHWLKQAALIRWTPFRISGCDGGGRTTARYARLEAVWNGAPCSSAVWSKKQCCRSGRISHRIRASDDFYEDLLGSHDEVEDNAATYDDFHHSYDEKRDRMKFHGENFRGRYKNEMDSKRKNLQSAHRSNLSSSDQTTSSFSSSLAESGSNKLRKGQERIESSRYYRQNDERTEKKDWRNENASSLRSRFHESEGRFQSEAEAMNKEARKKDVRSSDHLFTGKKESKEDLEKVLTTSILHEKNSKETSAQSKRILSVFKEEALASDLLEELKRQRAEIEQLRRDYQELLRTTKKEETNATKASSSSNVAYSKMEKQEEKFSMEMILLDEVRRQRFEMEQLNANCQKLMSSIKTEERESSSRKSSRKVLDDREELVQSSKQDNQTSNYMSKDHHETDAGRYSNYTNVSDKNEKIATSSAYMIEEDQQVRSNIVQEDHSIRSTTLNESSQEISERMNIQSSRVDTDSKLKVNVQKEGTSSAVSSVNERRTEVRNDSEISSKTQNRVEVLMKDREEVSTSMQHLIKVEREKRIRDDRQVILELNVGEESQGQCLVPDVYLIGTGTVSDTRVDQKQILISTSKENPGKREKKQATQERASTLIKDQKAGVSDSQLSSESKSMDYDSSLHLVLEAKRRQKSTGKLEAHFSFSENVEDQSTSPPLEPFIGKIKQNLSPRDKPNSASSSLSDTWIKESQPSSYWMEESQPASFYIEENQPTSFHKEENQLPSSRLEGSEPSSFYIEESQPASSQMGGSQPLSFHMEENQPSSFHVEEILPSSFRMEENRPSSFCMEESQSSSFRMEESQSTSFHIEESQPLSFPMEGTQPSSFHMEESRPSSLKMEEIQPLSFIVEESQPSSFRATESQPSSFHTEESQPSSFYIEEIMTPSVPIEESQPSSFPSLSRPSIAGASSQSQIEEGQLSPPQSQPSTVRYLFEIPIEEIQPPQFQIEENYPLPSLSRPVTAGVSSESMICESQPSLSWIDKSQPGPSQSDKIFSESQMEKSQLSTKQSQPSTARTSSQIEESQPSLLLIEENQPSVFQSQPSTAMASFKSEIKESPFPLLQMAERQQLHRQNQTSGDKVSSESPSENRLLPLLQRTKSQLSFEQSQTSSVRVSSESLIEENQQPPLAIENSQLNRSQQSTAATSPLTKRSGKSLWSFVADIFRVNWRSHVDPQKSTIKVVTKSSSNESVSSEAWYSGHELDHDEEERRTTVVESEPSKSTADNQSAPSISGPSSSRADGENKPEKRKLFRSNKQVKRDEVEESTDDDQLTLIKPHFHSGMVISGSSSSSGTERREGKQMRENESEKRKLLKRIKQVKREEVEHWEDAYRIETEQRKIDEFFMREALVEAKKAGDMWEVPVGAVLVQDGKIIARGSNLVEDLRDSTAHAEMICIREASNVLRTWRLAGTTLYVTLEPCPMCAGAILQARIHTIVWGAPNKLLGADGSWIRLFPGEEGTEGPVHPFHPKMKIRRGVLATECADALQQFFQRRRKKSRADQPPQPPPPPPSSMINYPAKLLTKMQNILCMMVCM